MAYLAAYFVIPTELNLEQKLVEMANYSQIIKPFYILALLPVNASSINSCLSHLNESTFNICVHEEAVFDVVYRYVAGLNVQDAGLFLKYLTGFEILIEYIYIDFNGEDKSERMIPSAHTCVNTLHVSRFILNYTYFKTLMDSVTKSDIGWSFRLI